MSDRITTTHVGSLPRSAAVTEVLFAREADAQRDTAGDAAVISAAVAEVVERQKRLGIDLVSDGEMSKISYATYIARRFSGFDGDTPREPGQDLVEFPGLLRKLAERGSTTNYIEHPELVAERIERFAQVVGRERVVAGTDCGFGTFGGFGPVEPDIAYLKLRSLVEGAQIASSRLWR